MLAVGGQAKMARLFCRKMDIARKRLQIVKMQADATKRSVVRQAGRQWGCCCCRCSGAEEASKRDYHQGDACMLL